MSHIFVILLGLLVLGAVEGEEESPVAISQSADIEERTAIQEDLNPRIDSRTINIKIINSEPLERAVSRISYDNDDNSKHAVEILADTEALLPDNEERDGEGITEDAVKTELRMDDERENDEVEERITSDDDDSSKDLNRTTKNSDDIEANVSEDISKTEEAVGMQDDAIESEDRSMMQDVMVESRGRGGNPVSLEKMRTGQVADGRNYMTVEPVDIRNRIPCDITRDRNFCLGALSNRPVPMFGRRLNDNVIPSYFNTLSRNAVPYLPPIQNFQNMPPYFGRLTNPMPQQNRPFENNFMQNTRRIGRYSTEPDHYSKMLEEYNDHDTNAYPYAGPSRKPNQGIMQHGLHQKLPDVASQHHLSQINHQSNEFSPVHYATNYPYGVNLGSH